MSVAFTRNYSPNNITDTDANFQAWGAQFNADLAAAGLVQVTSVTGQILWTTRTGSADGAITSGTAIFTSPSMAFTALDAGRAISIPGAGAAGGTLSTTILSVASGVATLAANASTTVTTASATMAAVTKPSAISTFQGLEVWAFNDTLQATAPVYIKFRYGSSQAAATRPGIEVSVGTAVSSAGVLTNASTPFYFMAQTSEATTLSSCFSGSNNRLQFFMFVNTANNNASGFSIERSKDTSGNDTGTYVHVFSFARNSTGTLQQAAELLNVATVTWSRDGGTSNMVQYFLLTIAGTGVNGSNIYNPPVFPRQNGQLLNAMLGIVGCFLSDYTQLTQITQQMYGTNHNYMVVGGGANKDCLRNIGTNAGTSNLGGLLMRYE